MTSASIHLALKTLPILRLQLAPQDLARRGAREGVDDFDALRRLERGDALACPGDHVLLARRAPRLRHDDRFDFLAPALRRHANDGDLGDVRVTVDRILD